MSRKIKKQKKAEKNIKPVELANISDTYEKRLEYFLIAVLLCWGIYHSILYFGHQVVPNPDYTGFVSVAKKILNFETPHNYKRTPILGIFQVFLSKFVGGQHPELTAGRLLNAIVHPLNIILLYLLGKRLLGKSAAWLTIVAMINPWVVQLVTEPIAETLLLFFTLLTFYLMLRRSGFCYIAAMVTSMIRYEGAALILAVFVMDMIHLKGKRERIRAFVFAALASIPLGLWMLGTILSWRNQGTSHYIKYIKDDAGDFALMGFIKLIWQTGIYNLTIPHSSDPQLSKDLTGMVTVLSKIITALSFAFGTIYGLIKRKWEILALLIFLIPYILVHAAFAVVIPRYCTTIYWIVLLICMYGLKTCTDLIGNTKNIPGFFVMIMQGVVALIAILWLVMLLPLLPKVRAQSPVSSSLPYVTFAVVLIIYAGLRFVYRLKYIRSQTLAVLIVCLMVSSNQLMLPRVLRTGKRDIEFKLLADWYLENAREGEKLVSSMANICRIFAPEHKKDFVHISAIKTEDPQEFVTLCYENDITYVTWDSRTGFKRGSYYYRIWGFKAVEPLVRPRNIGPYEFIKQIKVSKRRYINIFRLMRPAEFSNQQQ